jgi:hypothetical protein
VIWQPTMKSGEYAEPYRFKAFGSTHVIDRATGEFRPCTTKLCPKAEIIPKRGHHGDSDRASAVLPDSPLAGQLINRAPFYWSGDLGVLIRKSSPEHKKDLLWDFFVYANSPETSVHDVANYKSWLDSWRFSQLVPGDNFIEAGWSKQAYEEHAAIQQWAASASVNAARNLRLPGVAKYTRDIVGGEMSKFISGEITSDDLVENVKAGWERITDQMGRLDQLSIYRASLGLDSHSDVNLCRLHRDLMDKRDPSVCRQFDESESQVLLPVVISVSVVVAISIVIFVHLDRKRRKADCVWKINAKELTFGSPPEILGRGTFGLVLLGEYRGTQVAVKRVIPPKTTATGKQTASPFVGPRTAANSESSGGSQRQNKSGGLQSSRSYVGPGLTSSRGSSSGGMRTFFFSPGKKKGFFSSSGDDYERLKNDFIVEMRQLSKLRHPCVTTVMGAVISKKDDPQLVMEYMGTFQ